MAGLIFREARPEDHAALERLFRETSMAGAIRVGSDRAPDFFAGSRVQAEEPCVWGVFAGDGRAVGAFSMGKRRVWLNQEQVPMRYLSDLRIHPDWRNGTMLARGFRMMRDHVFEKGEWAQTLVLEQNLPALEFLRSRRAGLPEYREAGRYRSWLLSAQNMPAPLHRIRLARPGDLPAMQVLLDGFSRRRSFSPVIDLRNLGDDYLNGLAVEDFVVAEDAGEISGMMAMWDQSPFQRLRVDGYSPGLAAVRPLWNFGAKILGGIPLPPPGNALPIIKAGMIACSGDAPAILRSLLAYAFPLLPEKMLLVGLSEKDPLTAALDGMKGRKFGGLHFLVGWEGEPPAWEEPFGFDVARI
jgi:hypothetical protein